MTLAGSKYVYQRRLGGGGMAEVFLATTVGAEGFSRPVAIKRVLPSYSTDPAFASMFVNEARLSALLRHPNIVQVLDFDRDGEGRLYLVMELVEGKDLSDLIEKGMLPVPVVVHVIVEVLEGLAHAHDLTTPDGRPLGIVHRDISPHNVLVSWDGAVKVSDFGIAKAMLASGVAASGMIKGKPLYMAPEQVTAPDTVDQRADLFAVGVMLYEMLTGRRIYQGTTHEEVLTDVIQVAKGWRQLTAPNVVRQDLPWDVSQVCLRLLAPDRAHRFAHARDAIDGLRATGSAIHGGGDRLAELLAARFPGEAPPRVRRRAGAPPLVAAPDGGTWVVTPPPAGGHPVTVPLAAGTPGVDRSAPTATAPGAAAPRGAAEVAAPRRSPIPLAVAIAAAVAVAAIAIVVVMTWRGGSPDAAGSPADAAVPGAGDAAALSAAPDASVEPAPTAAAEVTATGSVADAGVPDATPRPDAGTREKRKVRDAGTGSSIHEVKIGGD